ncbi:MAG: hypothetical protein KAW41_03655 [Candidatus Diapherotrites archaeon]|nr:hypothetical protein [Candidatus Diapherotrites archaeon]
MPIEVRAEWARDRVNRVNSILSTHFELPEKIVFHESVGDAKDYVANHPSASKESQDKIASHSSNLVSKFTTGVALPLEVNGKFEYHLGANQRAGIFGEVELARRTIPEELSHVVLMHLVGKDGNDPSTHYSKFKTFHESVSKALAYFVLGEENLHPSVKEDVHENAYGSPQEYLEMCKRLKEIDKGLKPGILAQTPPTAITEAIIYLSDLTGEPVPNLVKKIVKKGIFEERSLTDYLAMELEKAMQG